MIEVSTQEVNKQPKEIVCTVDISPTKGIQLLREKANGIQNECYDVMLKEVSYENLAIHVGNDGDISAFFKTADMGIVRESLSRYALGQLCNKLGVPVRYIEKCIKADQNVLANKNLNTWIEDYNKDLFLRIYQRKVRGILSNRYSVLDTPDIIDVIDESTKGLDLKVKGYYMSEERFHARLVQQHMMKINGEDLYAGIQIDSSDVGRSPLNVMFFIYKQVCTNGLAVAKGRGSLFTQRHISICTDDFREQLSQSLKTLPTLISEYEHIIQRCANQYTLMGTKYFSGKDDFDTVLKEFIQKIRYKTNLTEDGAKKVVNLVGEKYGPSDWGVVNALTEVAQDYTLERRIELEKIAGSLLKVV